MISLIIFDVDGTITDGKVYINQDNKEIKAINYRDIDVMNQLKQKYKIALITAEDSLLCEAVKRKIKPDYFFVDSKDKVKTIQYLEKKSQIDKSQMCFIGDSLKDLSAMKYVFFSICPKNANKEVKRCVNFILGKNAGDGCFEEIPSILDSLKNKDKNYILDAIKQHNLLMDFIKQTGELIHEINKMCETLSNSFINGNKLLMCGNGGSAADCQHITTELVSRFLIKQRKALNAIALTTNTSTITAILNDVSGNDIFSRQVEAHGKKDDMLIGISTSGKSINVLNALKEAKNKKMNTVLLSGEILENKEDLNKIVDILIEVPSTKTARVQEMHIFILHFMCEYVERKLYDGGYI